MSRSPGALAVAALAASVMLAPAATLAFNPQPDPPGKGALKQRKSLGGPDTKGSWKRIHEVDEKSNWRQFHEVDKNKLKKTK